MFKSMFSLFIIFIFINDTECWGRRRRRSSRRRSGGGWSTGNGGVHYTFNNGIRVTGSGSVSPPFVSVSVNIPFGKRRKRAVDEKKDENIEKCNKCLNVREFSYYSNFIENIVKETKADLLFKAEEKDIVKSISRTRITFKVLDIYRTPNKKIQPGETFSIDADLVYCKCLPSDLKSGIYIIAGKNGKNGKLAIEGDLIKL